MVKTSLNLQLLALFLTSASLSAQGTRLVLESTGNFQPPGKWMCEGWHVEIRPMSASGAVCRVNDNFRWTWTCAWMDRLQNAWKCFTSWTFWKREIKERKQWRSIQVQAENIFPRQIRLDERSQPSRQEVAVPAAAGQTRGGAEPRSQSCFLIGTPLILLSRGDDKTKPGSHLSQSF